MFERQSLARVGIIGGSGFYSLLDNPRKLKVSTPYGSPSDEVALGEIGGVPVAFLARHGQGHRIPPHQINYRANIYALYSVGVSRIIGPCAAGSLQPHVKPGDFVISDQFVDRTSGRRATFYDGPTVVHVAGAEPYCPELRELAYGVCGELGISAHPRGTVVVVQGPRFSTRAESRWFSSQGWEVINMTQFPENVLARELEICYLNVALITDYDVGLEGQPGVEPVTAAEVMRVFGQNLEKLRRLIFALVPRIPEERSCICSRALKDAVQA
jgi:5'-methylthioadenosine phosphorylase